MLAPAMKPGSPSVRKRWESPSPEAALLNRIFPQSAGQTSARFATGVSRAFVEPFAKCVDLAAREGHQLTGATHEGM
jgi:hypothetical protein